jgi:hypothetical protein
MGKRRYHVYLMIIVFMAIILLPCYTMAAVPEGLILYLSFEEEGDPVDHSANPAEVSINGNLDWVDGKIGKALEFDGDSANIVEVAHTDKLEGMGALTIEAWVQPNEPASKEGMSVVSKRLAWDSGDVYNLFVWTGQTVRGRVNASSELQSQTALEDGQWYYLAYVFDPGAADNEKVKLYINGELEASGTHPDQAVNEEGAPLWIGELDPNRGFGWQGIIDEVGIWSIALSQDEIRLEMNGMGKAKAMSVEPQDKLATTWGRAKTRTCKTEEEKL